MDAGVVSARSLETITVSNTDPEPEQSATVLKASHRYRLVASGTVSDWCDGGSTPCTAPLVLNDGVDALYCYATWRCPKPEPWRQLRVNGVGLDELAGKTGKIGYSASHTYTVEITGISGRLKAVASDATWSAGGNSGHFTLKITDLGVAPKKGTPSGKQNLAPGDELYVAFSAAGAPGINGRLGFVTVGRKEADGGYPIREADVGGSNEDLAITRGVFGQHQFGLAFVSGRYYYYPPAQAGLRSAEKIRLRVRVVSSNDSSCKVGAQGLIEGFTGIWGNKGAAITLCGEEEVVESEHINVGVIR
jgi:hypothetical protein